MRPRFQTLCRQACILILVLAVAGCGGGGDSSSAGGGNPPSNAPPTANAGSNQKVNGGVIVFLSGSGTDADGTIVQYSWLQTSGTMVTLSGADTRNASFIAPDVDDESLVFQLTVTDDGGASGTDTVAVAIHFARTVECFPILPQDLSVDAGSSHTLQTVNYLYVDHVVIKLNNQSSGDLPAAVAYIDFNEDGHIDVFHAPGSGTPSEIPMELYLNDGTGRFFLDTDFFGGNPPGGIDPRKALTGDFNGDGRMDVFVLDHGYDRPPFPGAAPKLILSSPNGYVLGEGLDDLIGFHHGGASADIDYDGDIDVFTTGRQSFLINDGSGSFTEDRARAEGLTHKQLYTAELVDVDGDDFLDLLAAGHEYDTHGGELPTQILWGDSTGLFSTTKATILPSVAGFGVVVDIDVSDTDDDGDKDIVINRTGDDSSSPYNGYYVQLIEQVGERRFEDKTAQLLSENEDADANWFTWIRMCDFNGDDIVDIVVDDRVRNVVEDPPRDWGRPLIWENDGTGAFWLRDLP